MTASVKTEPRTIGALIARARQSLDQAGVEHAGQETMWLLAHALRIQSHRLVSERDSPVPAEVWTHAESLVARRVAREPLQYILGTQEFCGLEFLVGPAVLIPRPETALLVQEVTGRSGLRINAMMVDVGTGSGCVAVTLATIMSKSRILAIDRSPEALAVAKANAEKHGVSGNIEWAEGDVLSPLRERNLAATVDVIVSNPPYIAEAEWSGLQPEVRLFEPRRALIGGPTGTEFHERLLRESLEFLAPGGQLVMEVGQGQAPVVHQIVSETNGYTSCRVVKDDAGIGRVVIAQRSGSEAGRNG